MRNSVVVVLLLLLCFFGLGDGAFGQDKPTPSALPELDIGTLLMKSTFMIKGINTNDPENVPKGTCFLMARPVKDKPLTGYAVLITADHVMEGFVGQTASLMLRRQAADGSYSAFPWPVSIRDANGKPLWTKNPDADVAVMYVTLPDEATKGIVALPTSLLADDVVMNQFEVRPGDQLFCLGYPYGQGSPTGGFPILRGGTVASYPLTPAKVVKRIMYDFSVFPGNSGGPVYFSQANRNYNNQTHLGEQEHFLVGIVTETQVESFSVNAGGVQLTVAQPLSLASIVPAQYVLEAIGMLPDRPVGQ